jgi:hypothetical protein
MFGMKSGQKDQKTAKLSPPWIGYARKVYALFELDPDISIVYDEDEPALTLRVQGNAKAEALSRLLPEEKSFGSVSLKIRVVPANEVSDISDIRTAFQGNPAVTRIESVEGIMVNPIHYVVFENCVVQYFDDDLSTVDGSKTTLYKDLAAEVLGVPDGIFYCTEPTDDVIRWP